MTDTIVMGGYPVDPNAAKILGLYGLGRSFADVCRDTGQDPMTVSDVLGAAGRTRGRAAQMALAWQQKTGTSLIGLLTIERIAPAPSPSNVEMRAWAKARGIPVSPLGRVPAYVRIAFERLMASDLREPT